MPPRTTVWQQDEQTRGKHLVLQSYLDGWFPILGSWNKRLLFIDGFAGPGEYDRGEPGSPVIGLDCVRRCKVRGELADVEVIAVFMESDKDRFRHLENLMKRRRSEDGKHGIEHQVLYGSFDDHMTLILDYLDQQRLNLAPAFVMIDPFGVKGNRMDLIERILRNSSSECMISFMYEPIRRFKGQWEYEQPLDQLFGDRSWRECLNMEERASKSFLHGLFRRRLKSCGAKHVVFFEVLRQNRHIYTIYFATGHEQGCDLMKQAIWKADPTGGYAVRGYAGRHGVLFGADTEPLAKQLQDNFGNAPTPIEDIEQFVMSDATVFHKGHLRQRTLAGLEKVGRISVNRPQGGRGFPSGRGITIQFG
ncbi:MAG: three-Cys-motif partner protein TcmP [Gammaproteobacteria bacterium]|nr:three-Cys-motif partner protein TcmP [Gammaproteobacteria bacterium]